MTLDDLGPFATVLDVGGNVGLFAEACRRAWPLAALASFEPVPTLAEQNRRRADGRWWVEQAAVSSSSGPVALHVNLTQHEASTLHEPGSLRRERFGIDDRWETIEAQAITLDEFRTPSVPGRALLKVDVEGHELEVLRGAARTLAWIDVAIVEVTQDRGFVAGAPTPGRLDEELRKHGLCFAGVLGVQVDPTGAVVQFDGVWVRSYTRVAML